MILYSLLLYLVIWLIFSLVPVPTKKKKLQNKKQDSKKKYLDKNYLDKNREHELKDFEMSKKREKKVFNNILFLISSKKLKT